MDTEELLITPELIPEALVLTSGARLRALRKQAGLQQVNLAMLAHTGQATINRAEKHNLIPGYRIRRRICRVLGVEMADIWPDVNDEEWL